MTRVDRQALEPGLRGKLVIVVLLPGLLPICGLWVGLRVGEEGRTIVEMVGAETVIGLVLTAVLIGQLMAPLKRIRLRLRAMADAYNLGPAHANRATDDESILRSLDRALSELRDMARIDFLTGVGNRRACEERLALDISRVSRSGAKLSIALFDLDGLKLVNDRDGHLSGDKLIVFLADSIRLNTRAGDWVARWGGDEFLLGLWNTDINGAEVICNRVLDQIRAGSGEVVAGSRTITSSVGIAEYKQGQEASAVVANADKALRSAKKGGRDRSCVFDDDVG